MAGNSRHAEMKKMFREPVCDHVTHFTLDHACTD